MSDNRNKINWISPGASNYVHRNKLHSIHIVLQRFKP